MELTGRAKEEFNNFLLIFIQENIAWINETPTEEDIEMFYKYPKLMQYGVYQEFFWSYKIPLTFDFLPVIMGKEEIEDLKEIQFKRCNDVLNLKLEESK